MVKVTVALLNAAMASMNSPTEPACALSAAVVPLMPTVEVGLISPEAVKAATAVVPVKEALALGASSVSAASARVVSTPTAKSA